jgi:hypothetical protein
VFFKRSDIGMNGAAIYDALTDAGESKRATVM